MKDSPISFPGLFGDWEFTASSVALDIGHGVYWYGIIMAAGLLLALLLCMKQAKRFGVEEDNVLDLVLWGVPVGIIGARLYYVIFYLDLYRNADGSLDWGRMAAVWDGGLAIYGTVIAAFILAIIYCRRKNLKLLAITDLCVMGLLVGQLVGRWGNFMNREAFGTVTALPWRMRLWVNSYSYIEVHPTFLYESLWNLVGLALLLFIVSKARKFDGENTCFYFLWYGLGRAWIEGLRTDSLYLFNTGIRVSQLLSLVLALGAAVLLFYHRRPGRHDPADLLVNRVAAAAAAESMEAAPEGAAEFPAADVPLQGAADAGETAGSNGSTTTNSGETAKADEPEKTDEPASSGEPEKQ